MTDLPPVVGDHGALQELAELLRRHDYSLHRIAAAVEPTGSADDFILRAPLFSVVYGDELAEHGAPLETLAALLWFSMAVDEERCRRVLGGGAVDRLVDWGVLREAQARGRLRAALTVTEIDGRLLLSDPGFFNHGLGSLEWADVRATIAPPQPSSLELVRRLRDVPARSLLDVGCGTGLVGLLHPAAERVTAVDLNPRAVAFTRANAALNDRRLEAVEADALALDGLGSFDLVAFNAPTLPRLDAGSAEFGSMSFDEVVRFLALATERLVSPEGTCLVLCLCEIEQQAGTAAAMVRRRLGGDHRLAVDVEPLASKRFNVTLEDGERLPPDSALVRDRAAGPQLLARLRADGISRVEPVILTARPAGGPGHVAETSWTPALAL